MMHDTKRKMMAAAALALATVASTAARADLNVGDPAPKLEITEWIKGLPVDLEKNRGRKFHLVEFWATWCGPCIVTIPKLTELQKKYADDLVIIGTTSVDSQGNTLRAVKHFVESQGAKMDYTVAFDGTGKTYENYLDAARINGIPHCFFVGKDGNILWHGSPLDPGLEDIIRSGISGELTVESARKRAKANDRLNELSMLMQLGQTDRVRRGLLEVIEMDPSSDVAISAMSQVLREHFRDTDELETWVREHIAKYGSNAQSMFRLARTLCNTSVPNRTPALALEAARKAYDSSNPTGEMTEVYALALYQVGAIEKAIEIQRQAVERYTGEDAKLAQDVVEVYEQCLELKSGIEK